VESPAEEEELSVVQISDGVSIEFRGFHKFQEFITVMDLFRILNPYSLMLPSSPLNILEDDIQRL